MSSMSLVWTISVRKIPSPRSRTRATLKLSALKEPLVARPALSIPLYSKIGTLAVLPVGFGGDLGCAVVLVFGLVRGGVFCFPDRP
jgi:hypothetical protein